MASPSSWDSKAYGITDEVFLDAVMSGDTDAIMIHLSQGFDWNREITFRNGDIGHPLNYAIREFQTDVVLLLLELGSDPNRVPRVPPGHHCPSPLQYAKTLIVEDGRDNFDARRILHILENHVQVVAELEKLNTSRKIDDKINEISRNISEVGNVRRKLIGIKATNGRRFPQIDKRLRSIADQIRTLDEEKNRLKKEHALKRKAEEDVENEASYVTGCGVSYQRSLLKILQTKKANIADMAKDLSEDLECVVCLLVPTTGNIYSCSECSNVMCSRCVPRLKTCPSCRQNFKKKMYIRNLVVEKIVRKLHG